MHNDSTLDVLDVADVEAQLRSTRDERITYPAKAWLAAYELACWLDFSRETALTQAASAWDRAADDVEVATRLELPEAS
jgi:hypothetical protein